MSPETNVEPDSTMHAGVAQMLREELPGAEGNVGRDMMTLTTRVRVEFPSRIFGCGLAEDALYGSEAPRRVAAALEPMIRAAREQALTDYGLRPELERREAAAAEKGARGERKRLLEGLEEQLDRLRHPSGELPAILLALADWVHREARP